MTAKLWVTPLRAPRRPVSREARDGEQVEAAEWKSTNLGNKRTLHSQAPAWSNAALSPPAPLHVSPSAPGMRVWGGGRSSQVPVGWMDLHPEALSSGCPPPTHPKPHQ